MIIDWMPALSAFEERERASGLSLSQIETFLALVEEGSMARASRRLGVGRSTLSAHIKSLGDEFNQRLFVRVQGGLAITPAGSEAYRLLRPLMLRAGQSLAYFRAAATQPPNPVDVVLPRDFSGSLVDQAIELVGKAAIGRSPELWVSPTYGSPEIVADGSLILDFEGRKSPSQDESPQLRIHDRWILIRSGPNPGWTRKAVPLSELANLTLTVPKLPEAQLSVLLVVAEEVEARINMTSYGLNEIFVEGLQNRNFCLVMPAGLLNPALVSDHFECAMIEESEFDPEIVVKGEFCPQLGAEIATCFSDLVGALCCGRDDAPEVEFERLSLKYCRSFLALFEERNVRRAAQRLCIVQPALTVQLHGLEELLGTPLFERSHRGLQPNARAETLYALLSPLMARFGAAVRSLRGAIGGRSRRLRLGMIPALDAESETAEYFADALNRWSCKHPEIVVQVLEAYSGKLLQWLSGGRIDFALIDRVVQDTEMAFDLIAEDHMAVIVDSATDPLPAGPVTLENAAKLPLVLPSSRHGLRSILVPQLRKAGLELNPRIEVDSMAAAISLVKIGRYATILPVGAIYKSRDRRRLSIHEICEPRVLRSICLVKLRNELAESATQEFIEELRMAFSHAGEFTEESSQKLDADAAPSLATLRLTA
jgi:LysR family nitrogen assimilation transcriptional regulator